MTTAADSLTAFRRALTPLLDSGYRVALLCTGSPGEAESTLAEAAATAWRLGRAGAPPDRLRLTFYRMLLAACGALERSYGRGLRRREVAAAGLGQLNESLAALPNACRVAVILDLADHFSAAEIAEILAVPRTTACALLHLGYEGIRLGRGERVASRSPAGSLAEGTPNAESQDSVSVTKYWE